MRSSDLCNELVGEAFLKKKSTAKPKLQAAMKPIYRPTLEVDKSPSEVKQRKVRGEANVAIDHETSFMKVSLTSIYGDRVVDPSKKRPRAEQ